MSQERPHPNPSLIGLQSCEVGRLGENVAPVCPEQYVLAHRMEKPSVHGRFSHYVQNPRNRLSEVGCRLHSRSGAQQ